MIYVVLDTNIWLYLANGQCSTDSINVTSPPHFELLSELIDKNDDNYIALIVNEIIIEEWKRNKSVAEGYVNKLKNKIKEINKTESDYTQFVDTVDKAGLNIVFNKVKEGLEQQITENINHINEVEKFLLNACTLISVSEKSKLTAVSLALSKNAPFHNNKNNMADTLILLSSIEYLEQVLENDDQAYFVSNNTKDFCGPNLKDQFHSDIMSLIKNAHFKFSNNINDVVSVSREVQRELEYLEFLKSDFYLSTIQFECQTISCKKKDNCSYGYLTDTILVVQENEAFKNLNQLCLFDEFSLEPKLYMVKSGCCQTCGSKHIICPVCKGFIYDADTYYDVECSTCQNKFSLLYNDDGDLELTIKNDRAPASL